VAGRGRLFQDRSNGAVRVLPDKDVVEDDESILVDSPWKYTSRW